MEELLAYAYLLGMDLIPEEIYEEKLNELFLENPTDEDLLELEFLNRNRKETVNISEHILITMIWILTSLVEYCLPY